MPETAIKNLIEKWQLRADKMVGKKTQSPMLMGLSSGEINTLRKCASELEYIIINDE